MNRESAKGRMRKFSKSMMAMPQSDECVFAIKLGYVDGLTHIQHHAVRQGDWKQRGRQTKQL